ncbi:acetolactate synthase, large subunit, biosynthetic type, partial [Vibrio parahaemolyticus VPTS-2010]
MTGAQLVVAALRQQGI